MSNNKIQWDISCVRCSFRGVEPQGERLTYLFLFLYPCVRVWTRLFTARLKSINWKQQKERYKIFGLRKYLCRAKAPQNRLLSHRQNFVRAFSFFLSFLFFSFFFFFAFLSFSFNSLLFFSHCHARWSVTCYVWVKKKCRRRRRKRRRRRRRNRSRRRSKRVDPTRIHSRVLLLEWFRVIEERWVSEWDWNETNRSCDESTDSQPFQIVRSISFEIKKKKKMASKIGPTASIQRNEAS